MAVYGQACKQSLDRDSKQLQRVLKPGRMLQRRASQRMPFLMAGCCLGRLSSSSFLPKSSREQWQKPLQAADPVRPQLTLQQLFA